MLERDAPLSERLALKSENPLVIPFLSVHVHYGKQPVGIFLHREPVVYLAANRSMVIVLFVKITATGNQ